jgi:thiol-disulfide isomerase/thioredoxin
MTRWSRPAALLLLLVLMGAGTAVENGAVPLERPRLGEFIPSSPPVPAPTISLVDLAGNTVSLSEFAGRFVLINLWATWCEPCLREMPSLERMQSRFGDKITVLAYPRIAAAVRPSSRSSTSSGSNRSRPISIPRARPGEPSRLWAYRPAF